MLILRTHKSTVRCFPSWDFQLVHLNFQRNNSIDKKFHYCLTTQSHLSRFSFDVIVIDLSDERFVVVDSQFLEEWFSHLKEIRKNENHIKDRSSDSVLVFAYRSTVFLTIKYWNIRKSCKAITLFFFFHFAFEHYVKVCPKEKKTNFKYRKWFK